MNGLLPLSLELSNRKKKDDLMSKRRAYLQKPLDAQETACEEQADLGALGMEAVKLLHTVSFALALG
jgi:hypothetical protein